jgi:uncharacterized membrane protein
MPFCSSCGAPIEEVAVTCVACTQGAPQPPHAPASATTGGLTDNMAGMLAYVTIVPAIVFLVVEPYNRNRFIRFHSFQNIFFYVAWIVIAVGMRVFAELPVFGWLSWLLWPLIGLGGFALWIILLLKAYQGHWFKLPIIGDLAEKQAGL